MMKRAHLGLGFAAALASIGACSDSGASDYTYMDDDIPSGRCDTDGNIEGGTDGCAGDTDATTGPPPSGGPGSPCGRTGECDEGLSCSAPFSQGERGAFACVEACIPNMDDARWCADADGCCDPEAVCTMRGYCIGPDEADDGESTGGADDSSDDDSTSDDSTRDDSTGGEATTDGEESTGGASTSGGDEG